MLVLLTDVVTDSQVSSDVNETVLVDDASVNVDSTVNDSSKTVTKQTDQQTSQSTDTGQMYQIERILRKKYFGNEWHYRVKWESFPSSSNSWVKFSDLSPQCQQLVINTHNSIFTDKRSQKKH
jgi:hypothetical protein